MIETKNLNFAYDKKFYTLFNINLKFFDGQKYMIFSEQELESKTLFRILSKQEKGYSGDIFFDGKNLREISAKNLDICYLVNSPILFKHKSVLYNIAYPLIVRKSLLENQKYLFENTENNLQENNLKNKNNSINNNTENTNNPIKNNFEEKLFKNNEKILKYSKNNAIKIAEKILEKYNLSHLKNKKIKNLTKDEKISLILLRCAIRKPKIIFFDYFDFNLFNLNLFFEITKNALVLTSTTDKKMCDELNKNINETDEQFTLIKFVGGSVEN